MIIRWPRVLPGQVELEMAVRVSVVVAMRNEAANIPRLLVALQRQVYDKARWEIILVDDHSTDDTVQIAKEALARSAVQCHLVQAAGQGKKAALREGIAFASGDIILTTDADCDMGPRWVHAHACYFAAPTTQLVSGGVRIAVHNFFSACQALEFSSLIGTGAASLTMGHPTMANGANLAFRKAAFERVDGYAGNEHIPSGDDEFLLRKIHAHFPAGVFFNAHEEAVVTTQPASSVTAFLQQRIRWASKWRLHGDIGSLLLPVLVVLLNLMWLMVGVGMIAGWISLPAGVVLLLLKVIPDIIFLRTVGNTLRQRWRWGIFLVCELLYPVYAMVVGVMALQGRYQWKDRPYKF